MSLPERSSIKIGGKFFYRDSLEASAPFLIESVTFEPGNNSSRKLTGEEARQAVDKYKHQLGINTIVFPSPPPLTWLNACEENDLLAIITHSWFRGRHNFNTSADRKKIRIDFRDLVKRYQQHPSVIAYLVADPIGTEMIRYSGARPIERLIERLIDTGKQQDSDRLFSFPNPASLPIIEPDNQDFATLSWRDSKVAPSNLHRLPILITDCPAKSGGRLIASGFAGVSINPIKPGSTGPKNFGANRNTAPPATRFSVIICADNSTQPDQLANTIDAIANLNYAEDTEVIVINNGNSNHVRELIKPMDEVRHVGIPKKSFGKAQIIGAKMARHNLIAYLTAEQTPDSQWLKYLAHSIRNAAPGSVVMGKTLSPTPTTIRQAAYQALPRGVSETEYRSIEPTNIAFATDLLEIYPSIEQLLAEAPIDQQPCSLVTHHPSKKLGLFNYLKMEWQRERASLAMVSRRSKQHQSPDSSSTRRPTVTYSRLGTLPVMLQRATFSSNLFLLTTHIFFLLLILAMVPPSALTPQLLVVPCALIIIATLVVAVHAMRIPISSNKDGLWARLIIARGLYMRGLTRSLARGLFTPRILPRIVGLIGDLARQSLPQPSNHLILRFRNQLATPDPSDRVRLLETLLTYHPKLPVDPYGNIDLRMNPWGLFFQTDLVSFIDSDDIIHCKLTTRLRYSTFLIVLIGICLTGYRIGAPWWLPTAFIAWLIIEWAWTQHKAVRKINQAAATSGVTL